MTMQAIAHTRTTRNTNDLLTIDINSAISRLTAVHAAMVNKQSPDFWHQCVRDATGRWEKYYNLPTRSKYKLKYFQGRQNALDYSNEAEVTYLRSNLDTRHAFYAKLAEVDTMTVTEFRLWLESLRRTIAYRHSENWLHKNISTPAHTLIVKNDVLPLAKKYRDPYASGAKTGPVFPGFPPLSLPTDVAEGELVYHHYPTLEYADLYLSHALAALKDILRETRCSTKEYIHKVAYFFQLLINLHYFAGINASLYMNMANGLLEIASIKGIEHGIIDFVALRLQPNSFQEYFYDEVMKHNRARKTGSSPSAAYA